MNKRNSVDRMPKEISWIFELEDDGTVLHSSFRSADASASPILSGIVGHNFFDDAMAFDDIAAFERHFKSFVKSHKAAERLTWKCSYGKNKFDARVSMTRAFQTGYYTSTGVVMLEIKNS